MRLMILTPSFSRVSPVVGALAMARFIHRSVDAVDVVFGTLDRRFSVPYSIEEDLARTDIPSHCFELNGFVGLRTWKTLDTFVRAERIDAILSFLIRPDIVNCLQHSALRVLSIRGHHREGYPMRYGRLRGSIGMAAHRWAMRRADRVFAMSESMANWMRNEGVEPSRIAVHHNFLDVRETVYMAESASKHVGGSGDDRLHIGWFGRLEYGKRPDLAVELASCLVRRHGLDSLQLHMVGDGPMRAELEQAVRSLGIQDHVRFHGYQENPLGILAGTHLVISTSISEGVSRALMEALALGRTVVAVDTPGLSTLIQHGETGYLTPFPEIDMLAEAVTDVVTGEKYLDPEALQSFVRDRFDVKPCVNGMVDDIRAAL